MSKREVSFPFETDGAKVCETSRFVDRLVHARPGVGKRLGFEQRIDVSNHERM